MCPVQSVTDVPVHSLPLAAFAVVFVFQEIRVDVAGRNEAVTKPLAAASRPWNGLLLTRRLPATDAALAYTS
jgi:hypothetical protein